jgi:hypothetical protein
MGDHIIFERLLPDDGVGGKYLIAKDVITVRMRVEKTECTTFREMLQSSCA